MAGAIAGDDHQADPELPVPSVVALTTPNGAESWEEGYSNMVYWTDSSYTPESQYDVYALGTNLTGPVYLGSSVVGAREFRWTTGLVPEDSAYYPFLPDNSDYKLRVCTKTAPVYCDESDDTFTIIAPTHPTNIHVNTPNGGESYRLKNIVF